MEKVKKIIYKGTTLYEGEPTLDNRKYFFRKSKNGEQYTSKKYLTKDECEKAKALFTLKNDNPINKRFDLVADDYFEYLGHLRKDSTVHDYKADYYRHIYPYFKNSYINALNVSDIRNWAESIEKKGYKIKDSGYNVKYLNNIYNVLKNIFDFAIKNYSLENNPVALYGRFQEKNGAVKKDKDKIRYITKDEFDKFISVIDVSFWKTWFIVSWYTGCRIGELQALTWEDIDFSNNVIIIDKTLSIKTSEDYIITSPKNSKNRTITMNDVLKNTLLDHKNEVMKYLDFKETWFVFGNSRFLPSTTIDRNKDKYFKLSGVRRITNHEFRHSIITYLANTYIENCTKKNINIDTERFFLMLSKRDGHTVETLKRNYLHLFPTIQNEIVDLLNNS